MNFTSAAYIQMHFRLSLIMEANTISPDQAAQAESILFAIYAFSVYLQMRQQATVVGNGR